MKELICVLIGGFLFLSCNNQNKNKTAEEDLLPDSIPYVEIESYDSSGASTKNKCIKIFEALGDTIFGEVLYGMDIKEANNSVHNFLNKLNSANYSHKRNYGFVFADIHFMDIAIIEAENEYPDVFKRRRYHSSFTWKGKLSQIVWESYSISKHNKSEVGNELGYLVSIFEKKFGKGNMEVLPSHQWFQTDYENHKNYFIGGTVAGWKTDNRLVEISINGKDCPKFGSESGEYKYTIDVRFYNRTIDKDLENYFEESQRIENENYKKEQQQYINAL